MDFTAFVATIILVSLSGVMMPGPVFATAMAEGRKNKHAGFLIATGHAIVEVPIIFTLFFIGEIEMNATIKSAIGLAGGIFLLYFAFSLIKEKEEKPLRGIFAGIILSSLNPYFIMWWMTVGFTLAIKATLFDIFGLLALIIFHELCDFVWYEFVSFSSNKGVKFKKVEKILLAISFSLMIFFGFYFIYDSIKVIMMQGL